MNGLIVDLFAGGGGASTDLAWALGRDPDIAINHDANPNPAKIVRMERAASGSLPQGQLRKEKARRGTGLRHNAVKHV